MTTRQIYPPHFTGISLADDPHPRLRQRECGHPRPALRVSASLADAQGRRLVGLSCPHLELGPLFDQQDAVEMPLDCEDLYFDIDPIDLKGAEAKLLEKLIDDHRHYLPADACEFADRADYEAHRQDAGSSADDALPEFRES